MEEQNKPKTVSINSKDTEKEKTQKLSYEQLNDACNQLWQQNKQLVMKNRELEQFAMNKRLDYLFKVIENSKTFSSDFVVACTSEIEEAITIPQEISETKEKE